MNQCISGAFLDEKKPGEKDNTKMLLSLYWWHGRTGDAA
jgi:hypothetical protein